MFKRTRYHANHIDVDEHASPTLPTSASWPLINPKGFPQKRATSQDKRQAAWERQRRVLASVIVSICLILAICLYHRTVPPKKFGPQIAQRPVTSPTPSITRGWQPPLVDRYILRKLDRLGEEKGEEDWEQLREEGFPSNFSTVPLVDHIPEVSKKVHTSQGSSANLAHERLYPAGTKFLLPSWIGEQESKAKLHLVQLAYLAILTNRTLVLPNLAKGRMGTCMRSPFDVYYDSRAITNSVGLIDFADYVSSIPEVLTGSIIGVDTKVPVKPLVSLDSLPFEHIAGSMDEFGDPSKAKHNNCLKDKIPGLQFREYSPVWITSLSAQWNKLPGSHALGTDIVAALNSPDFFNLLSRSRMQITEQASPIPDILVMEWNLRYPVFPGLEGLNFPYAAGWTDLAGRLALNLPPFIGIHWRMETVHLDILSACSEALIQHLTNLLLRYPDITAIYFATDYPIVNEQKPRSGTFGTVHTEQREAIARFSHAFEPAGELSNLTLVNLDDLVFGNSSNWKLYNGLVPSPEDWDLGLFGIVDKLVLMRSPIFVGAGPSCGKSR
jgi:hypothetical protein